MKIIIVSILIFSFAIPLFADDAPKYPIYLRLKFDKGPESEGYLWERRVLPDDMCWAELSYDGRSWESLSDLPRRIKVGVALGGGGVCGLVHVGALRAFEENNIPVHGIAGTSMGAIIGGLYACGYSSDRIETVVDSIDWNLIFSERPPRQYQPIWEKLREKPREPGLFFNLVWDWDRTPPLNVIPFIKIDPRGGLREGQKFIDEIAKRTLEPVYLAGFDFDSLKVPFGAMLTNLDSEKITFKRNGTISTATRASGSVPIAFEPLNLADSQYVDGAVLNDLPVDAFIPFDTLRAPKNAMQY
ncbi:patatin-like phospholipase family protein, partial [candidate division WOR-3 bacterium]|nr:patatin-like phospholipase family protein [candidate division WOR-3 bacterium]